MPTPTPVRPLQKRSEETLRRIVEGALAALAERDLEDLSAEDIARAAGVSVGTLYTRFKSKDDILAYVLQAVQEAQLAQLAETLAPERWTGVGLTGRLEWLSEQLAATAAQRPALIRAIFGQLMSREGARNAEAARRNGETAEALAAWLLASGEVTAPDPVLAARMTAAWLSYSLHMARLYPFAFPGVAPEAAAAELVRAALAALKPA